MRFLSPRFTKIVFLLTTLMLCACDEDVQGSVALDAVAAACPPQLKPSMSAFERAGGIANFEFEIVQLTRQQANNFKEWLDKHPKSYTHFDIADRHFYSVGGGGWHVPVNKLIGGVGNILDNNVLIKFSMPKLYSDESVPMPVAQLFHEIAVKNGL